MEKAPFRSVHFGPRGTELTHLPDGSMLLRSPDPLQPYPDNLTQKLLYWAEAAPERTFIARRSPVDDQWIRLSYRETLRRVRNIAQALLARGLSAERPVMILSENSLEHAMLGLAALHAGIPYAPISPAYSTVSTDYAKLRHCYDVLTPGLVFAQSGDKYLPAIEAVAGEGVEVVFVDPPASNARAHTLFAELEETEATDAVESAHAAVGPDTIAKFLFTSGSTGMPKGVINTQRMLCSNQQQILQAFPFLGEEPPVIIDWLPWNHTFGGNHNVGMMLYNGGSLYMDDGLPMPGAIEKTVRNLREIAPTVYFNVPKGYEQLLPYLRDEPALRDTFFSRVAVLFYAGAGLTQPIWDGLEEVAVASTGRRVPIITGLGCTESSPSAMFANWAGGWSGLLGVPVAGLELKLTPSGDLLEARYRGPNVTPGYWRHEAATRSAFDADGFYCTGDAVSLVDPARPEEGMVFDGRVAENFKLSTGTWVTVGKLRDTVIAAGSPVVQDTVIAGHDRDYISVILFLNPEACKERFDGLPETPALADLARHDGVRAHVQTLIDRLHAGSTGSANRVVRAVIAEAPASVATGELTDKGSINQRAAIKNRAATIELLYTEPPAPQVLVAKKRG